MLSWLTRLAVDHHRRVLIGALVLLPVLLLVGGRVEEQLSVGGFVVNDSDSAIGDDILEEDFGAGPADWVVVFSLTEGHSTRDEDFLAAGESVVEAIEADPGVTEVVSFWTFEQIVPTEPHPLASVDRRQVVLAATFSGDEDDQRETATRLEEFTEPTELWTAAATGPVEVSRQARESAERDLQRSELIAAPLTLIALLFVFRGLRPALLPLVVAVFAVLGTFTALSLIARLTTVSVFALNLTTALGLGLAIDYCLLMVARFREELARERPVAPAISHTVQTAGRTVLYSGATVAASLLALLVFPVAYLRSFAYAGVAVVVVACAAAVIVLPALLTWLGDRVGVRANEPTESFWGRQARRVTRRPVAWVVIVGTVLVLAGLPFARFEPSRVDDRVLPADNSAREAADLIREKFTQREFNGIGVVVPGADAADEDRLRAFQDEILAVPDVYRIDSDLGFFYQPQGDLAVAGTRRDFNDRYASDAGLWVRVISRVEPEDPATDQLVRNLRDLDSVYGSDLIVTGNNASIIDAVDAVESRLPLALTIIAVITLVVLFMMTGSVVVPLKAVVLNMLSLTATFGALVWIFQDGHLAGLLDFTATGEVDVFTPILMFCVAFGLSMDYEVFLLSRIKEEYDLSGDNDQAIVAGIGATGRIVTAAAVLLSIVFVAIGTSGVTVVKMFGVGLTIAVLVDAFLVRATLTPALMKLAGRANWWAPRPLRRFHLRWGLWENEPIALPEPSDLEDERPEYSEGG